MWIREPGKIVDGLDFVGTFENSLYLLRGEEAMIIGGGMSWVAPAMEKQFAAIDFEPEKLKYLLILHSHFDHCAAVPYLKRKFPHMQILASEHSAKVLSKEKVVNYIAAVDRDMIGKMGLESEYKRLNLQFDGIQVDRVVTEKDIIDLGEGIEVHIIEAPGHTECSIVAYVPEIKALFTADNIPTPIDSPEHLFYPSPQYDFALYKESQDKITKCDVKICTFEHHGVVIGDQAKEVLHNGLMLTEKLENLVVDMYRQTGDIDKIAQKLVAERLTLDLINFGSTEIWTNVAKYEARSVLRYAGLIE